MSRETRKPADLSMTESAAILGQAADMRPDENFHDDPSLRNKGLRGGGELTAEEAAAIMRLAANIRPTENFHPDED